MSKIDYLNIGDIIYVTGIEANLYECHDDDYETLLSVVGQECKVVDVSDDVELYYLPDVGERCVAAEQRGVLIQSPKLQGHNGNGRCPEFNCYWIGRDYLSFSSMSMDDTMNIFDKLNESDDFGWAKEIINQEYNRYGDILPYLDYDDIISITGDFTDDYGNVLLSVEDAPFKVYKKNNIVYLKWVQPKDKRPKGWEAITNNSEKVHMGDSTFEWDKELMVKFLHKEDHPF